MSDKTFSVKVYVDGKIENYKNCDKDFIITLLTCPACETSDFAMQICGKDFVDTVNFFR